MIRTAAVVFVLIASALSAAEGAVGSAASAFHVPGKFAECVVPVAHEVPPNTPPVLVCWAPRSGVTFAMGPTDKPSRRLDKSNKGYHDGWSAMVRLGFGREWAFDFNPRGAGRLHFLCFSRRAGLTCRNRAGHGWLIDRKAGSRLF